MFKEIKSPEEFQSLIAEKALLAYFSTDACSVCHVLKPKVEELVKAEFPKMKMAYVKSDELPEIAADNNVFTAPTVVVFFEGHEYIRKSRAFGVEELQHAIERIYSMLFSE